MGHSTPVEGNLVALASCPDCAIGLLHRTVGDRAQVRTIDGSESIHEYALAELSRFRFEINTLIRSRTEGECGIVVGCRELDGLATYRVQFSRVQKRIPERDILDATTSDDPLELLRDGRLEDADAFILAFQARRLRYAYTYEDLVSLSNSRIELLPHQVFVAHRVLTNYPHRFLLADEVGLGKTIEAGLIIKELRARGAAGRVLIVVPAGLVPQWVDELRSKFNEHFTRIDSTTIGAYAALHGQDQLWSAYDSIVTSLHLVRGNESHVDSIAQQDWDMVIFDEAHHVRRYLESGRRDERRLTGAYRLAQRLQSSTTSMLLLTATPLQLHPFELFSLVELLDPTLFPTFEDFEQYRVHIPELNDLVQQLDEFESLSAPQKAGLSHRLIRTLDLNVASHDVLLDLTRSPDTRTRYREELGNRHRLTLVMLRNRKRQVFDDIKPRTACILQVAFSPAEQAAYDAVTEYIEAGYNQAVANNNLALGFVMVTYHKILTSSSYALRQSFRRRIARLQELGKARGLLDRRAAGDFLDDTEDDALDDLLQRYEDVVGNISPDGLEFEIGALRELCAKLETIPMDTKAAKLLDQVEVILANPREKVLIFTQFRETLAFLEQILRERYRVVTFYGGMDAEEKDTVVDAFRKADGAQIMIATEAAGEGRNLQFCHVMVNYDLPWNPMKIEQRIGRLDRIGQEHPVEIYNFAIEGSLEDRLLQVLHDRIRIFETTVGSLDPILGDVERDIRDVLLRRDEDTATKIRSFEERVGARVREAEQMETKLNDFILDSRSFRRDQADALLGRKPAFSGEDIREFVSRFLRHEGGHVRERSAGVYDLTIPWSIRTGESRELKDSYRATFNSVIAQRQDTLDFVAFGHDVLDRAVEVCLDDRFGGRTACLSIESDDIDPIEAICAVHEFTFDGVRPRKELGVVAVSMQGEYLPLLSERFGSLVLRSSELTPSTTQLEHLQASADACTEVIERVVDEHLERRRREYAEHNALDYNQESQKLERFYDVRLESATRDIRRLEATLADQQASQDPNAKRILPATRGRLAAARQQLEVLETERKHRLRALDHRQTVSYSVHLIGAAFVVLQSVSG